MKTVVTHRVLCIYMWSARPLLFFGFLSLLHSVKFVLAMFYFALAVAAGCFRCFFSSCLHNNLLWLSQTTEKEVTITAVAAKKTAPIKCKAIIVVFVCTTWLCERKSPHFEQWQRRQRQQRQQQHVNYLGRSERNLNYVDKSKWWRWWRWWWWLWSRQ